MGQPDMAGRFVGKRQAARTDESIVIWADPLLLAALSTAFVHLCRVQFMTNAFQSHMAI